MKFRIQVLFSFLAVSLVAMVSVRADDLVVYWKTLDKVGLKDRVFIRVSLAGINGNDSESGLIHAYSGSNGSSGGAYEELPILGDFTSRHQLPGVRRLVIKQKNIIDAAAAVSQLWADDEASRIHDFKIHIDILRWSLFHAFSGSALQSVSLTLPSGILPEKANPSQGSGDSDFNLEFKNEVNGDTVKVTGSIAAEKPKVTK